MDALHNHELKYPIHPFLQIVVLFALTAVMGLFMGLLTPTLPNNAHLLQSLSQIAMFGISSIVLTVWFYKSPMAFLHCNIRSLPHKAQWLLWSVIIIFIATPAVDFISHWNENLHLPAAWSALETAMRETEIKSRAYLTTLLFSTTPSQLLLNLCVAALIPALCEELFFRGVLQQILQRWTQNIHLSVWITGMIFSLLHWQMFGFFPRWLLGIILGYLFAYSQTLWLSVTAHFINNAIVVVLHHLFSIRLLPVSPSNISFSTSIPIVIISASATIFILIQCYFLYTSKTEKR